MEHIIAILEDPSEQEVLATLLDSVAANPAFPEVHRVLARRLIAALKKDGVDTGVYSIWDGS